MENMQQCMDLKYIETKGLDDPIVHSLLYCKGWITSFRNHNSICFFTLTDGSTSYQLQVIYDYDKNKENEKYEYIKDILENKLNTGCFVKVCGVLVESPAKNQLFELSLKDVIEYSMCDSQQYPLKKNNKLENLREYPHLRCRTKTLGCVMRIRNTILYEIHNFYQSCGFLNLDPNSITLNECEGGAGVFSVTEFMNSSLLRDIPNKNGVIQFNKDHFKKKAFLTVSSQLQLEGLACSLGNVYTMNKSFRSEHSLTRKHVSEFTHLEIEMIDVSNNDLMDIGEKCIKYVIQKTIEKNSNDIETLDSFICKGIKNRMTSLKELKFHRVSYKECIDILRKYLDIQYGDDLSSEAEEYLTNYYKCAVFVYDWPYAIKSFYMKQNNDTDKTCSNFDLLMPFGIGELIGGSMREENYETLLEGMKQKNIETKELEWYLDLRRFGTVRHGGFGLGIDRLIMLLTGMKSIKDVIPYPVYYQNLQC